jgi:predicted phosphate transport protein (TIGR00153 family)
MLGWFQAIMPKEDKFFDLFEQHAALVVAGAEALRSLLKGGEKVETCRAEILARENEADEVARQVLVAVRRTFITPFDRSDIQRLIGSLDDAIDQMNKTAKIITLFEVRSFEAQMQQIGELSLEASKLVLQAMPLLRNIGKNAGELNTLTEQVIRIEERADELHDDGRKALFLANRGPNAVNGMDFTIGTEIYDHLEKVVDRLEDVAKEVNSLVVDHL